MLAMQQQMANMHQQQQQNMGNGGLANPHIFGQATPQRRALTRQNPAAESTLQQNTKNELCFFSEPVAFRRVYGLESRRPETRLDTTLPWACQFYHVLSRLVCPLNLEHVCQPADPTEEELAGLPSWTMVALDNVTALIISSVENVLAKAHWSWTKKRAGGTTAVCQQHKIFFRPTPDGSRQVVYQAGKTIALCKFTELMQWQHQS